MPRYLALTNAAGGVGKSTLAANLAAVYRARGLRVLAVDLDPQATLTGAAGLDPDDVDLTVSSLWLDPAGDPSALVIETEIGDVIPAALDLARLERMIGDEPGRELILRDQLGKIAGSYDLIVVDCPPGLHLTTTSALCLPGVRPLVPVCDRKSLDGWALLAPVLAAVRDRLNPDLGSAVFVLSRHRSGRKLDQWVADELAESCGRSLLKTRIPDLVAVGEAMARSLPVISAAPTSPAAVALEALADELGRRAKIRRSKATSRR